MAAATRLTALLWIAAALFVAPRRVAASMTARAETPTLTVDVRAVSTSSGEVLDTKHVLINGGAGVTVSMDVFAVVSGYSHPEELNFTDFLHGSFLSSFGGMQGNLRARITPDYGDFIAGEGFQVDLDGDGDLDVGSNDDTSLTGFFRAYHRKDAPYIPEARVGTLTWTRTGSGNATLVNFRIRNAPDAAGWAVDGDAYFPTIGVFRAGDSVIISYVPEPISTASLSLFMMLVQASFKRPRDRRSHRAQPKYTLPGDHRRGSSGGSGAGAGYDRPELYRINRLRRQRSCGS
jgi:hypothetical protein